jgi:hypothetical protein
LWPRQYASGFLHPVRIIGNAMRIVIALASTGMTESMAALSLFSLDFPNYWHFAMVAKRIIFIRCFSMAYHFYAAYHALFAFLRFTNNSKCILYVSRKRTTLLNDKPVSDLLVLFDKRILSDCFADV